MTIKERAFEKYPVNEVAIPDIDEGCPSWLTEDENAVPRVCYIKGATEQKQIDIEEFKNWLFENAPHSVWEEFVDTHALDED